MAAKPFYLYLYMMINHAARNKNYDYHDIADSFEVKRLCYCEAYHSLLEPAFQPRPRNRSSARTIDLNRLPINSIDRLNFSPIFPVFESV